MISDKFRAALLFCALVLVGPSGPGAAQEPKPDAKPAAKAEAKTEGRIVLSRHGKIILLDPADPKAARTVAEPGKDEDLDRPSLSPDGTRVIYMRHPKSPDDEGGVSPARVMLLDLTGKQPAEEVATGFGAVWGPDPNELLVVDVKAAADGKEAAFAAQLLNPATGKAVDLSLPKDHMPFELSGDGKWVVTQQTGTKGWKPMIVVCRVSRDGKKVEALTDPAYLSFLGGPSPDGKAVAFSGLKVPNDPEKLAAAASRLYVQPVGGKVAELPGAPAGEHLAVRWSPDGKRLAYLWRQMHKEPAEEGKPDERETETRLYVCDADGKNHRLLLSEKGKGQHTLTLSGLDWR